MNKLNVLHPLPTNQAELQELSDASDENAQQHLCMVKHSQKLNRCPNKTVILLHGHTGAGKSSFINQIFKDIYANVSHFSKGTDRTVEYVVSSDDNLLASLALVDTPGFGDVNGDEQDVKNIISIKKFFQEHAKLDNAPSVYPNLIMVLCSASDNRIVGSETNFCKSLKALNHLELVDNDHPNVLVVFTHACSVSSNTFTNSSDGSAMWSELRKLYNYTLKAFACYLKIIPSVVFVESQPEAYGLPVDGNSEWTILPCGTRQPINVFKAMMDLLKSNGDNLAAATISHLFLEQRQLNPWEGLSVTASEDGDLNDDEEALYAKLFPETESNPIQQVLVKSNLDKDLHEERDYLAEIFIENGVKKIEEIKGKTFNDIAHILYPYSIGPKALSVLKKFNLVPELPERYLNQPFKDLKIGMGYDIYHDKVLDQAIYSFAETERAYTLFGISMPNAIIFSKHHRSITKRLVFTDKEDYIKHRLNELGVALNEVRDSDFDVEFKSGYSIYSSKISFKMEEFLFSLMLNEYEGSVSNEFKKDLKKLPGNPNTNMSSMQQFFEKWGQFVVLKVYGGGTVEWKEESDSVLTNSISWHGGVQPENKTDVKEMICDWKDSLRKYPIIIDSQMELKPICKVVEELAYEDKQYENACNSIKLALEILYGEKVCQPSTIFAAAKEFLSTICSYGTSVGQGFLRSITHPFQSIINLLSRPSDY